MKYRIDLWKIIRIHQAIKIEISFLSYIDLYTSFDGSDQIRDQKWLADEIRDIFFLSDLDIFLASC